MASRYTLKIDSFVKVNFESFMGDVIKDIEKGLEKSRTKAALHVKKKIHEKTLSRKKTGNLAKGVYHKKMGNRNFVGIHAPGYQAYILEFGQGRLKKPAPSVYNTFEEEAGEVQRIMSEPV